MIQDVGGTHGMINEIKRQKSNICRIISVLDNDNAGIQTRDRILESGLLPERDVFMIGIHSGGENEIENSINPDVYCGSLHDEFGRDFSPNQFRNPSIKWSKKFSDYCISLGMGDSDEDRIDRAKKIVADSVMRYNGDPLIDAARPLFDALLQVIFPNRS